MSYFLATSAFIQTRQQDNYGVQNEHVTSTPPSVAVINRQVARFADGREIRALWQKLVGGDTPTPQPPVPRTPDCLPAAGAGLRKVDANLLDRNQRRIESLVETGKVKKRDQVITVRPQARCWSANTRRRVPRGSLPPTASMTSRAHVPEPPLIDRLRNHWHALV